MSWVYDGIDSKKIDKLCSKRNYLLLLSWLVVGCFVLNALHIQLKIGIIIFVR